jgi:hypothetical protein
MRVSDDVRLGLELHTRLRIVPRELLEPLPADLSRSVCREEAADLVDSYLRRLSRREALARVAIGRIAEAFLRRSAHNRLGFARVGDYTRERLGLCASQFYDLARVARELGALPFVASAFERGEIGWTKLREITAVAKPETEAEWLELARCYTADGLKIIVKKLETVSGGGAAAAADDVERFALKAVATAVEQARREAGYAAPSDDPPAAPDVAAALEDDEVDGEPPALFRLRCPRRVWRLWHRARELARRVAGSELADWQIAETIAAEALSASGYREGSDCGGTDVGVARIARQSALRYHPAMMSANYLREPRDGTECPWGEDYDEIDVIRWQLPLDVIDEPLPEALTALGDTAFEHDAHELDRRMRKLLAATQLIDGQMGALLRTCFGLRLYLDLGYRNQGAYVRNRLGMCSRKSRGLVAMERKSLYVSSELTRAYRDGRLSWYRALMLLPIVDEANAQAWIERACSVAARRLRDELEWALEIQGNAPLATVMPPPAGAPLATRPCPTCGVEHDFREFHENDAFDCGSGDERQIRGHGSERCAALRYPEEALADVEIRIRGPVSVISLLIAAVEASKEGGEPPWRAFERVLAHVVEYWESAPRHRDPIYARDGWRCAAPACTSRRNLHDHHIVFRSQLGGSEHDNRITVCAFHHLRGIHIGTFRVAGRVSKGLIWEVGVRPGKPPLIRCAGDTYVDATEADNLDTLVAVADEAEPDATAAAVA